MKSSIKQFYKIILLYLYKTIPIMYLYESKSKNKKYTIVMEDENDINNDAPTHSTLHK